VAVVTDRRDPASGLDGAAAAGAPGAAAAGSAAASDAAATAATAADADPARPRTDPPTDERRAMPAPVSPPTGGERMVDPRAVRVSLAPTSAHADVAPIVVEPPAVPLAPSPHLTGTGVLGGAAAVPPLAPPATPTDGVVIVDGNPARLRFTRLGPVHGVLLDEDGDGPDPTRTAVVMPPADGSGAPGTPGASRREVVVDGWRIEVEVESERRASLRERARRGREETSHGGPTEVHAIIPGVVVGVSVVPGDAVVAGQQLLVVEAMKMQNELRAPRDGTITRVAVGTGRTIEVGDLLLVLD
jgi:biotin carboxyl carrier protein